MKCSGRFAHKEQTLLCADILQISSMIWGDSKTFVSGIHTKKSKWKRTISFLMNTSLNKNTLLTLRATIEYGVSLEH